METGLEIAVIGMAGRFPGARNIDEFWYNLKNGIETITHFSDEELLEAGVNNEILENPNYVKAGGMLADIEYFDAAFFGYTPKEAEIMDPQVRIFHECTWTALEDAGYDPLNYKGLIGLYAGAASNLNWHARTLLSGKNRNLGNFAASQLVQKEYLCLRVSYKLNLNGPSLFVYTTCSTSLVAIHLGYQSLLNGECDIALAGGVTILHLAKGGYMYEEGMIESPDGHCRAFNANAKGIVGSDGVGIVALKRLEDAISEKDHIYAVIKGSAINNDGMHKAGFTAPSVKGQAEVIKMAMQMARVESESIGYVETHGTGTELGDPVEIQGLKLAFNVGKKNYCGIGSIKSNLGHTYCAAGVAGFIKTVLAINYRMIPPTLHFEIPNPGIDFIDSPFYVNTMPTPWESNGNLLRAGVSSFGQGGTNAHVILEEFVGRNRHELLCKKTDEIEYQIIILSARTPSALDKIMANLAHYLKENPHIQPADLAYTLQVGRHNFKYRKMFVCSNIPGAVEILETQDTHKIHSFTLQEENRPVVFIFPGKEEKRAKECNDLAEWLITCGIKPYAVIGQDNGEITAWEEDTLTEQLTQLGKLKSPIFIYFGSIIEKIEKILTGHGNFSGHIVPLLTPTQKENPDLYFLTNQIGHLWLYGVHIDWEFYNTGAQKYRIPLPTYPFEGRHYWIHDIKNLTLSNDTNIIKTPEKSRSILYPRPELKSEYVPPASEIEIKLAGIWSEFFGFEKIGSHDDFFELGGDSLKVINLVTKLQKKLKVLVPIAEFFYRPTISGLAEYILANPQKNDWIPIEPAEKREYYPLALTQRRIFILQQLDPENISYNIPDIYQLDMKVDIVKFEDIFKKMIQRQESFRTFFGMVNGEPIQRIQPTVGNDFAIEYHEITGKDGDGADAKKIIKNFIKPFDLSRTPLLRVGLIKIAEGKHLLMTDMHHLISDGISLMITMRDFLSLFNGEMLPELPIQYKDFTMWQLKEKEKGALKKQEEYWFKEFEGVIPELRLPLDYIRPSVQNFVGSSITFTVDTHHYRALKELAENENATLFMVLLAIFNVLLSYLSGQEQIIVGTGVAGRNHEGLINLVGTFINTIPIKSFPIMEKTFRKFLNEIREKILLGFTNQDYPFEELVEKVVPIRDRSRNPLFDVFLMSLGVDRSSWGTSPRKNFAVPTRYEYDTGVSKFDIGLLYWEDADKIIMKYEYNIHLFKKETIERFITFFKDIIAAITLNKNIKLAEIEITHALLTASEDVITEDSDDFEF